MNIQEAIKKNTVIHCETEEEAVRILNMAHELGYNWGSERSFTDARNSWRVHECETCYYIIDGICGPIKYHKNRGYKIINSTEITGMKKSTDWTPAPEDLLAMNQELTIKPPLGLIPKKFHDKRVKAERFNEVCGAITRYYNAGMKINIEWIQEYNELVESLGKHYR